MPRWSIYVVRTSSGQLYTGIATNVRRRLDEHEAGTGAKALRGRGPLELVYRKRLGDRGLALRVEHQLKRRSKVEKEAIVRRRPTRAGLLALLVPGG
jgi:putative endonuclease